MDFLERLRAANIARNEEWENKAAPFTTAFWANELGGEAGEACNVLKKLDRERLKVVGSRATVPALAEELADVVICVDLLGMHLALPLSSVHWAVKRPKAEEVDYSLWGAQLIASAGRVAALAVHPLGRGVSDHLMPIALNNTIERAAFIAAQCDIDLARMVTTKFNMTSEKVGLNTRLA